MYSETQPHQRATVREPAATFLVILIVAMTLVASGCSSSTPEYVHFWDSATERIKEEYPAVVEMRVADERPGHVIEIVVKHGTGKLEAEMILDYLLDLSGDRTQGPSYATWIIVIYPDGTQIANIATTW